jgi:hypothetical protein
VKDVTITEEVVAEKEEAQADLVEEAAVEVSDQEKKVVSEVTEVRLQEKADSEAIEIQLQEKAVSEVTEMLLQEENQVPFKEKKEHQDVLKVVLTDRPVVHLTMLKQEDREKANAFKL